MYEDLFPSEAPAESLSNPDGQAPVDEPSRSAPILTFALAILATVAVIAVVYGWHQHRRAQELLSSREELQDALTQARHQADALSAQLTAAKAVEALEVAAREQEVLAESAKNEALAPPKGGVSAQSARHPRHLAATRPPADDPRWQQVQQQLAEQQRALDEDKRQLAASQANLEQARSQLVGDLEAARTELGGGIARNHDELVAFEKMGERNYTEFDITKATGYHHAGPISISLRKADTKHEYCDLDLVVNDSTLSKKHINLYESITFYPEGEPMPLQMVINRIGKDFVHGYVSEPKHRPVGLARVAANSATPEAANPKAPPAPEAQPEHRAENAQ